VHINKSPVLAPAATLTPDQAVRWNISGDVLRANLATLKTLLAQDSSILQNLHGVYTQRDFAAKTDVDTMLYSGGFWSGMDKKAMAQIHATQPKSLASLKVQFQDPRGDEMFFRFRARNYPEYMAEDDHERWAKHCMDSLLGNGPGLNFEQFSQALQQAVQDNQNDQDKMFVLQELQLYAESIYPSDAYS